MESSIKFKTFLLILFLGSLITFFFPPGGFCEEQNLDSLEILYPLNGTLFPLDITAPTFRWISDELVVDMWTLTVRLDGSRKLFSAETNQTQWKPDVEQWNRMKENGQEKDLEISIEGKKDKEVLSQGTVKIRISKDEVGAQVFYREVPLPFDYARKNLETIRWHLGDISEDKPSKVMLANIPLCGNCHSFSKDGRVMGMDVDYGNDKGSYAITPIDEITTITPNDVISWSDYRREDGEMTFGLLAQMSPDGRYAVSTVKDRSIFVPKDDLFYSQLFFPIKGILAIYDCQEKIFSALAGADDLEFVQSNPTWTPDGSTIIFARAPVHHIPEAEQSTQAVLPTSVASDFIQGRTGFQFDLYRIPFNEGKGGKAEPIPGASNNGKSNFFPRVSPDGKWIVFTQAKNFMLLQPDSKLYIMPVSGGTPREMTCNTNEMNSWHSFSPNGKWMVFSSKKQGAYTRLYLTHIDDLGNDTPPVYLENLQSEDRACNIPEFVNLGENKWDRIEDNFTSSETHMSTLAENRFINEDLEGAIEAFDQAVEKNPNDPSIYFRRGDVKMAMREYLSAIEDYTRSVEIGPNFSVAYKNRGDAKFRLRLYSEAIEDYTKAIEIQPNFQKAYVSRADAKNKMEDYRGALNDAERAILLKSEDAAALKSRGDAYFGLGDFEKAIADYDQAQEINPNFYVAFSRRGEAKSALKDFSGALEDVNKALEISPEDPDLYITRATIKAISGDYFGASDDIDKSIELDPNNFNLYINRGIIRENSGDFMGAEEDYSQAIGMNPQYYKGYNHRASARLKMRKVKEAFEDINRAIELNPGYSTLYLNRGNFYYVLNNFDQAIVDYNKAIEMNPDEATAYSYKGDAQYRLQDYQAAKDSYDLAIEKRPDVADNYLKRGMMKVYLKLERDDACRDFEKAKELGHVEAEKAIDRFCRKK